MSDYEKLDLIDLAPFKGHTEGPWKLGVSETSTAQWPVVSKEGAYYDDDSEFEVAEMSAVRSRARAVDTWRRTRDGKIHEANAALIAAAPSLLAEAIASRAEIKRLNEDADTEATRWQNAIYEACVKRVGEDHAGQIDGRGCDSGDYLEFTLAEIQAAFNHTDDTVERLTRELEELRRNFAAERSRVEALQTITGYGAGVELEDLLERAKADPDDYRDIDLLPAFDRWLLNLHHRVGRETHRGGTGDKTNGYAVAEVPDWDVRQKREIAANLLAEVKVLHIRNAELEARLSGETSEGCEQAEKENR